MQPGSSNLGKTEDTEREMSNESVLCLRRCDCPEPLLSGGVPDLGLDAPAALDLDALGGELDADGRLGLERELVAREAVQQVRLPHAGVAHQHHCESGKV